jgi:hypothetical protein
MHGELLKLGIDVGQTTVAKYMASVAQPDRIRSERQRFCTARRRQSRAGIRGRSASTQDRRH